MDDQIFVFIENAFSLNKPQVLFANYVLKQLNEYYNRFQFIEDHKIQDAILEHFECELTDDDISYTLDKLEHDLYFIEKNFNYESYKLTHNGKEVLQNYKELILYLGEEAKRIYESAIENLKDKNLREQIDNLTLKQLKGTIFQVNKWWLILIINAIVTIAIAVIVAWIGYKMGLN